MTESDSIFGAELDRLRRLLTVGEEEARDDVERPPLRTASLQVLTERPGMRVGRYKLLDILGEGGMGIVYLAEQTEPLKRRVALKVIKPGMDSQRVIARFEAERQALALLDHPNIAHVYDAGTTEAGRPYFVMEYVGGLPITDHCDEHKLTIEQRLRLFQYVCLAVHHAHQKGIIHRDIKPSNILVSAEDDRLTPKIIDFGVAKAIAASLTEGTMPTADGHWLGTPEYMSPEQAEMVSDDIDTRSDVYSLGVLLYVLLAGILPYDSDTFRQGGVEHIRTTIRETDPKTPSTRLTKLGDEAAMIAKNRGTQINALARHLRSELEWIPLKAMRKDRAERYRSASELADDVDNYLNGKPLVAGPPTMRYQLAKFVRRHRALVAALAAVLIISLVGAIASTVLATQANRARAEAQMIADFLERDVLGSVSRARVGEATLSFVLDAASQRLEGRFENRPLVKASILWTLAYTYRELGESQKAERYLLDALDIYEKFYGQDHRTTQKATSFLVWIYEDQGRYHEMEALSARIGSADQSAVAQYHLGEYGVAVSSFERLRSTARESSYPFLSCNLARAYAALGRYEEAEQLFVQTLAGKWPEDADNWKRVYSSALADMYREQGRYDEAERLFVETLETQRWDIGDEHVHTLGTMYGLARLYLDQDRYEEAEALLREALSIAHRRLRPEHPVMLCLINTRAALHSRQGHYDEAETLFRQALTGRQRELGSDHPATLESMHELALLYIRQARHEHAEPLLLDAFHGRETKLGPEHPHTIDSLKQLATLYEFWPKPDEAAKWRSELARRAENE